MNATVINRSTFYVLVFCMSLTACIESEEAPTSFTDSRDGVTYPLVTIGEQTWMTENLRFATDNSICHQQDPNCEQYGRYYNWEEARTACPEGWRLATDDEWKTLERELGMAEDDLNLQKFQRGHPIGRLLKPGGSSGMNLKLAGAKFTLSDSISSTNWKGYFWTGTPFEDSNRGEGAYFRAVSADTSKVERNAFFTTIKLNCRCIQE